MLGASVIVGSGDNVGRDVVGHLRFLRLNPSSFGGFVHHIDRTIRKVVPYLFGGGVQPSTL